METGIYQIDIPCTEYCPVCGADLSGGHEQACPESTIL
jgi:hypothetical protein